MKATISSIEAKDMLVSNPKFSRMLATSKARNFAESEKTERSPHEFRNSPFFPSFKGGTKGRFSPVSKSESPTQDSKAEQQFFFFRFEKNPLDGHCDLAINVKMNPLDIIVNASSIVHFCT